MFGTIVDRELQKQRVQVRTRMATKDPKNGIFRGIIIKATQQVVVTDILRAGSQPSNIFYLLLCSLLDPSFVRQDHIMSQRQDSPTGVKKSILISSKIGGSVQNKIIFIPDPMGATGHSAEEVIDFYLQNYGVPKKIVCVNLVITPTYLARLRKIKNVNIHVYASRLDHKLTRDSFILPGLGGVGEIVNNTRK